MPYVSAKYVLDPDTGTTDKLIHATDDQGRIAYIPGMDCDVGDWLDYVASGGTVEPYDQPATQPAAS